MNRYSKSSRTMLDTCHPDLVRVLEAVLPIFDHKILEGARTLGRQQELVAAGRSKTMNSRHLVTHHGQLSLAVDVVPYPFSWDFEGELLKKAKVGDRAAVLQALHNIQRWAIFVGHVLCMAAVLGVPVRWGGDWDGDKDLADQDFDDWPHFELVEV